MLRTPLFAALILALTAGAGCFASVYDEPYDGVYANEPPPAPYEEAIAVAPAPGWVWVAGYWTWTGRQYTWVDGTWRRPPRAGHIWVDGVWARHGNGRYYYAAGRWAPRARVDYYRARRPAPVHRPGPPPARTAPHRPRHDQRGPDHRRPEHRPAPR